MRCAIDQVLKVPFAIGVARQIQARLRQAETGNLDASPQQRAQTDSGSYVRRSDQGLSAECRIVPDQQVIDFESRPGKEPQANVPDLDVAAYSL